MIKQCIFILLLTGGIISGVQAQNFPKQIKEQRANIESIYKKKRITEKEYYKLLQEQDIIKEAYDKYNSDGYLSPEEKNRIASKLQRAAKRLRRYQSNAERY
ncbi:MAG: hypothetical protein IT249_13315 [Chitinophagaceae bacterium]|nr:hypothetical protein [Chitinophagaceae bacterium]